MNNKDKPSVSLKWARRMTDKIERLEKENKTLSFKLKNSEKMLLETYEGLTKNGVDK